MDIKPIYYMFDARRWRNWATLHQDGPMRYHLLGLCIGQMAIGVVWRTRTQKAKQ